MSKRLTSVLAVIALVATACGSSSSSPTSNTQNSTQPSAAASQSLNDVLFKTNYKPGQGKQGGTIVMGEWQKATQLNPFYTTAFADFEAIQPILRGFLTISSDGKYIPDLAESVPTIDNGGVKINGDKFDVTVKLRSGLKWSDGEPLTGADFKYTWQWALDKNQKGCTSCAVGFPSIEGVDVSSDGLTITMHWKELYASWLSFLTGPATILPEHYMKNIAIADASTKSMPVSADAAKVPWSGPFMVTAAGPDGITYKPNPNWAAGVGGAHKPYLDTLKFQFFGDKQGMIAAFKAGEIDLALDLTQADASSVKSTDASIGAAEVTPSWQYEHFDLNLQSKNSPFLADANVRKAIAESIDKQSIIDAVFPGAGVAPACSAVPPGLWYRKDIKCPAYNPDDAKKLLDAAGLKAGSDGNRTTKDGKPIDILLCTTAGNPTRLTELQKLQGYLQAVGLKSHIVTADATSVVFAAWNDLEKTPDAQCSLYRGNYDIADYAYIIGGSPYSDYDPVYDSANWPEKGDHSGANDTRFASDQMDSALKTLKTAVDPKDQITAMQAVQDAYGAGLMEIPIYYRAETTGVGVRVGNWPGYNPSSIGPTWNVEDWFVKG